MSKTSPIPRTRLARLVHLGSLAGSVAGGMLTEGLRQFSRGNIPRASDLALTPANARRVANKLSELRGAAMKVGQLLSMDAGDLLPPEFSAVLARLRAEASPMPMSQVVEALEQSFGPGWQEAFSRFSFTPVAAASIGQVHTAITEGGRHLALKIQYPGIRQSIDSDVDNVATLLRVSGLVPKELALEPLLQEAKRQLHGEADYCREAAHLKHFASLLQDAREFRVPGVYDQFIRDNVLAMELLPGEPVEKMAGADQAVRDRIAASLLHLLFRELFEFRLVQTDPNFANFLYNTRTGELGLLDFGATRQYSRSVTEAYRALMGAALQQNRTAMAESAQAIGYFRDDIHSHQRETVMKLFTLATEPARTRGVFDFGASDLALRIRDAGMALSRDQGYWHTPPVDAVFLHRKIAGFYLLAARLEAKIDVGAILEPFLTVALEQ